MYIVFDKGIVTLRSDLPSVAELFLEKKTFSTFPQLTDKIYNIIWQVVVCKNVKTDHDNHAAGENNISPGVLLFHLY